VVIQDLSIYLPDFCNLKLIYPQVALSKKSKIIYMCLKKVLFILYIKEWAYKINTFIKLKY
jgi:hypothetical protein